MPKTKNDHVEKTPKLLFKNSKNTINTYSKTYSGVSQVYTKSLILQLKHNLPNAEYYEENGRVKRDLSIETDICILRGYYKKRRNRFINRETVSTKSKYSVNRTEIDTIDEFKYDSSACGDSERSVKIKNAYFNVNLTSLVVQNLKNLLNNWVKKYLLDSGETKEKVETVLDSILHKIDLQGNDAISSCTYTVDIEVKDQKQNRICHRRKSQTIKQGSLSVPLSGNRFRILSTLSLPKNINRPKISKCSWNKLNRIRHKKILLSANGSSKYLFTSSSLNFLTLPTTILTKHCATYQQDIHRKNEDKQNILGIQDELYDIENLDSFTANARNSAFNMIPSIYKNIYKEIRHKKLLDSRTNDQSRKNVHEQGNSEPLVSIDFLNQSFDYINNYRKEEEQKNQLMRANIDKKVNKITKRSKKSKSKLRRHKNVKSKKFTYFFRKSKNYSQQQDLLYHFQSIFKMISSYKCGEDIKLDIHVNVFPSGDSKTEKKEVNTFEYSYPPINNTAVKPKIINGDPVCHNHNIIPILDGAISHAKYIMTEEISGDSGNNNHTDIKPSIEKNSQIAQEISELKMIIKSLASTTEKFVSEHLTKKRRNECNLKLHTDNKNECVDIINAQPSIGVQFSSRFVKDDVLGSGIKLKKDPKKKHREYNPRLIKRSTSYNIIDSESILKVTDMTSATQGEINVRNRVDRALTCSLPKTKSLFEVSCGKCDENLCEDLRKPREYVYVFEHKNKQYIPSRTKDTHQHVKPPNIKTMTHIDQMVERFPNTKDERVADETRSSSVFIDIETKTPGKKITVRHRTGIRFCEGCCYCIFLWIPVIAILLLFHEYVLKYYLPEEFSLRRLIWSKRNINKAYLRLTLADLGF